MLIFLRTSPKKLNLLIQKFEMMKMFHFDESKLCSETILSKIITLTRFLGHIFLPRFLEKFAFIIFVERRCNHIFNDINFSIAIFINSVFKGRFFEECCGRGSYIHLQRRIWKKARTNLIFCCAINWLQPAPRSTMTRF